MRCLILGGAGFIGSHIVDALVTREHKVRVFDRINVDTRNLADVLPHIDLIRGDFLNESDVSSALQGTELVVHLISTTLPKTSNDNPVYDVESNVVGTLKLLNLSRQIGVKKIVFLSSGGAIYGPSDACPISENTETNPICSYGITKLVIEKYLHLYNHLYDLDYVVLRAANAYGERQNLLSDQGVIITFLQKILLNEPISIWGDGSVVRDYIYISDLVSAILTAIERQTPSRIYNIGSGIPHSLNDLLNIMRAVPGRKSIVQYSSARKLDVPINFLDISRAKRELLWQPQVSIEEGITRTWAWLQKHMAD
jgi:UDP-glucose 4-epimerase